MLIEKIAQLNELIELKYLMKELEFGSHVSLDGIDWKELNNSVEIIDFTTRFNKPLENATWPASLKKLCFRI